MSTFVQKWVLHLILFFFVCCFCKVHHAETRGAVGIILFSDPADYTGGDTNQVYPKDWWLPPTGTQRGTVYTGDGDPLTADYPALGRLLFVCYIMI